VTGGPGSGKSTVARLLAAAFGTPVFHLDEMALDLESELPAREAFMELPKRLPWIAAQESWITEGSYMGWATPLFDAAELLIWLKVPGRVALYRILLRRLKADLARDNRFPGWRRLARFWRWSARYYLDRNPHTLGFYGVPETAEHAAELLRPYEHKLVACRSYAEALQAALLSRAPS